MNLRQQAIADMKELNIRDWSLPVVLISPDGVMYNTDTETGNELKAVQILYDRKMVNPESGEEIIVKEPIVTIAISSLARVPKDGEKWSIRFAENPATPTVLKTYVFMCGDHAFEGGDSLGFIRIYPVKTEQSV